MNILYGCLIFGFGVFIGFIVTTRLKLKFKYAGTIFVTDNGEKRVYTLELEDYPDEIRFKKEVLFKIDASDLESLDRS
jgi:hypothetical protein